MSLPYNRKLTGNAKRLRENMTDEESKLWYQFLSRYPVRFLRQKVIDNYIMDFYCARFRLGVELDGRQHETERGKEYDEARTKTLNAYGVSILRFTNGQVRDRFNDVCREIDDKVGEMIQLHSLEKSMRRRAKSPLSVRQRPQKSPLSAEADIPPS